MFSNVNWTSVGTHAAAFAAGVITCKLTGMAINSWRNRDKKESNKDDKKDDKK